MARKIVAIVEGEGEVNAFPNLLSRLLKRAGSLDIVPDQRPWNAHGRDNLTTFIERFVESASLRTDAAGILVLLDADIHCAYESAILLANRIRSFGPKLPVAVVCAARTYEAWFLASMATISGFPLDDGIILPSTPSLANAESEPSPSSWINRRFPAGRKYKKTSHQLSMTRRLDLDQAHANSRSFRRLISAVDQLLHAIDAGEASVTPIETT